MLTSKLKKIAVTGGLASGKSIVCRFFNELGAYVVSADEIVHQLLSSPTALTQEVVDLFGPEIIVNGQIKRSQVAKIAFQQPTLLKSLEDLLHPAVRDEIDKHYLRAASTCAYPLFVAEIPLLFETGADQLYDDTVAVIADEELCMQRYEEATGCDANEYHRRMARQLSQAAKASKAGNVIVNNGSLAELKAAAEDLYKKLSTKDLNPPRQES